MTESKRGKFITFEGCDGCGKSTQIKFAAELLAANGYDVLLTREPGGTLIGEKIRMVLLDPENDKMADMAEMMLYAAARAQIAREVIEPALAAGRLVICDRWVDSSLVYQGAARGLGEAVRVVNTYAAADLFTPDATVLLDLEPAEALARATGADDDHDRIEALGVAYQDKVRAAYLELARREPGRFFVIGAAGSPEEVQARVAAALLGILSPESGV